MCHLVIDGVVQQVAYHSKGGSRRQFHATIPKPTNENVVTLYGVDNIKRMLSSKQYYLEIEPAQKSDEREPVRIPDDEKSRSRSHGHRGRNRHDAPARRRVVRNFLNRVAV